MRKLNVTDPEIFSVIHKETRRQEEQISLIASENYASSAILEASGSVLTNKYAEGYPGKRYYAGCQYVDEAELLAIKRCKELFGAEHANVQPHAGSQANMAVYFAALKPGDTIMGMSLAEGGHLTHGHRVNFSGNLYKSVSYGVNKDTHLLDYDAIEKLAIEHKPKLIIAGASAYSRTIDFARFADIAKKVGAYFMADIAHIAGLVATGLHNSPIPFADFVTSTTHKTLRGPRSGLVMCKQAHAESIDKAIMPGSQGGPFMQIIAAKAVAFQEALQPDFKTYQSQVIANAQTMAAAFKDMNYSIITGGTDNHLFILDLRNKNITGRAAEAALEKAGITSSRSCIPNDPQKPWITSGIRFGTPAITTRGITKKEDIQQIAQIINDAIINHENETLLKSINEQVSIFCSKYPIY
jgi:glycine hydroxymethyltransferase